MLKQMRIHAGLTQTQMAAGLVSESFYSKVERGVHSIDAETLINILQAHHFDVVHFFQQLNYQKTNVEPNFELSNKVFFAQNKGDIEALDEIAEKIKKGEYKDSFLIQLQLANAYVHMLGSCIQIKKLARI